MCLGPIRRAVQDCAALPKILKVFRARAAASNREQCFYTGSPHSGASVHGPTVRARTADSSSPSGGLWYVVSPIQQLARIASSLARTVSNAEQRK